MTSHELVLHTNTQTLMSSTFLILLPLQMGPIIYLGTTEDAALSALAILPPRPTTGATLPPRPTIGPWKTLYRKRLCVISYSRESSCSCLCYTILQKVKSELIIIDIFMNCCTYHWRRWHRGAGNRHRAPVLGTQLGKRALGGIGPLLGVLKLMLYLAVLGKVDSGDLLLQNQITIVLLNPEELSIGSCRGRSWETFWDTYSLFDLSLVCLDLILQFFNEFLQSLVVLAVFVSLEGQFLHTAIGLAHVLLGLGVSSLFAVKFTFKFSYLNNRTTVPFNKVLHQNKKSCKYQA